MKSRTILLLSLFLLISGSFIQTMEQLPRFDHDFNVNSSEEEQKNQSWRYASTEEEQRIQVNAPFIDVPTDEEKDEYSNQVPEKMNFSYILNSDDQATDSDPCTVEQESELELDFIEGFNFCATTQSMNEEIFEQPVENTLDQSSHTPKIYKKRASCDSDDYKLRSSSSSEGDSPYEIDSHSKSKKDSHTKKDIQRKKTKTSVECPVCKNNFSTKQNMRQHREFYHFICKSCDKDCKNIWILQSHLAQIHPTRKLKYIANCKLCDFQAIHHAKAQQLLDQHSKINHKK